MKTNELAKVFRLTFPKMILVAVFFAAVYTSALLLNPGVRSAQNREQVIYESIFGSITPLSTGIFVSILGSIVLAIYFERFLSLGITRKNILLGFLATSCALSACLSFGFSITGLILGFYTPVEACLIFCSFILICAIELLAGFAVVVGCLFLRWYTAVIGIVCCIIISNVTISMVADKAPLAELLKIVPPTSPLGEIAALLTIAIITLLALLKIVNRVPFKC